MGNEQQYRINISVPNLVNICVDQKQAGEISGRLYHCYSAEPIKFLNIIELLREMEKLFDAIVFPQASTKTRCFVEKTGKKETFSQKPERVALGQDIVKETGAVGTFVTDVRFRQNSTWQGVFWCAEKGCVQQFSNTLDFIKQIDSALTEENNFRCSVTEWRSKRKVRERK